jgi:hypothetical protein
MKTSHGYLALALVAISACGSSGDGDHISSAVVDGRAMPSDEEILAKVYDNSYQWPDNFYMDERADTPGSYTFYHVKDASLSYELCTDEYYQALEWEAADNDSRVVSGYYVGSYENERYFEFIRELSYASGVGNVAEPTSPGFARVFKCNYVNRDGVDRNLRNGYAGTLNVKPLSREDIRTFTEYMWQFAFFWPAKKKVLESITAEAGHAFQQTLLLALATSQGTGRCDLIEVVDWVFSVDKASGQISKAFKPLYTMRAHLASGVPQKCED